MLGFTGWFWNRNDIRLLPLTHTSPEIIRKQKGRNPSLLGGEAGPLRASPPTLSHTLREGRSGSDPDFRGSSQPWGVGKPRVDESSWSA